MIVRCYENFQFYEKRIDDYIEDILEAMTNAMEFTKDMSYDELVKRY